MIDTVQIGIQDYEIEENNTLIKKTFTKMDTGQIIESYFYNGEILNLNIDGKGLSIKTNLSKLYGLGDFNFYPLGANSFKVAIDNLARALNDIGIVADLDGAKVWRLDLFKNIQTEYPYQAYKSILSGLNLKRTNSRVYPEGYLLKNGQREVMFYNKIKELKGKFAPAYIRQLGFTEENVIRGEERFLKHKEVKKHNIDYLKEIPDKWDLLKETYQEYMQEIFKYDYKEGESLNKKTFQTYINRAMLDLILKGKEALKIYGLYPYSFINKNELLNALLNQFSRRQAYRILANIETFKKHSSRDVNYKKLYEELKEKFLNN